METRMDFEIEEEITGMVQRIVERFQPERIILFGSHARGEGRQDSDVDLMVVMQTKRGNRHQANEIDRLLTDRRIPLDIVVVSPEQFEAGRTLTGTIIHPAAREGKVLYERAA